jgi:hypothetical protein
MAPPLPNSAHGDQLISAKSRGTARFLCEPSYLTRLRRTSWLGRRDSKLCISKSDLLNFIPPQRVLGVDRARL